MPDETILIAEDEPDLLELCTDMLLGEGYNVIGAHNGPEAIRVAQEQHIDLLLTDIRMPGMTGLEVYRAIKEFNRELLAVMFTGYGAVGTVIEALQLGVADFMLKPFSLARLSGAISGALAKKRLERENAQLKALIPLFELSESLMATTDMTALPQQVLDVAVRATGANTALLLLGEANDLAVVARVTPENMSDGPEEYRLAPAAVHRLFSNQESLHWRAGDKDELVVQRELNERLNAALALPLLVAGEMIGVLCLGKTDSGAAFAKSEIELLTILGRQAAVAIQNARLFTEVREAYEQLRELDRMKSEFVSMVSHELRAPLHSISGFVQLLATGKLDQRTQHEALKTVVRQTRQLGDLVRDLLDVSRIESGRFEIAAEPMRVQDVIHQVLAELRPMAEDRGISLSEVVPADLAPGMANADRIAQVVRNLVHNAIKFTPRGGQIVVSAAIKEGQIIVSVADTGIGIPAEALSRLFERFYQVDSSDTRRAGGTGLGLYISRQIVTALNGSIWVESEEGRGSTFSFSLPLHTV